MQILHISQKLQVPLLIMIYPPLKINISTVEKIVQNPYKSTLTLGLLVIDGNLCK